MSDTLVKAWSLGQTGYLGLPSYVGLNSAKALVPSKFAKFDRTGDVLLAYRIVHDNSIFPPEEMVICDAKYQPLVAMTHDSLIDELFREALNNGMFQDLGLLPDPSHSITAEWLVDKYLKSEK